LARVTLAVNRELIKMVRSLTLTTFLLLSILATGFSSPTFLRTVARFPSSSKDDFTLVTSDFENWRSSVDRSKFDGPFDSCSWRTCKQNVVDHINDFIALPSEVINATWQGAPELAMLPLSWTATQTKTIVTPLFTKVLRYNHTYDATDSGSTYNSQRFDFDSESIIITDMYKDDADLVNGPLTASHIVYFRENISMLPDESSCCTVQAIPFVTMQPMQMDAASTSAGMDKVNAQTAAKYVAHHTDGSSSEYYIGDM